MQVTRTTATILHFTSRPRPAGRMSPRDHAEISAWIVASTYDHLAFEASAEFGNPDLGDFFLIYRPDSSWSSWGVGRSGNGFIVWEAVTTETLGWYGDMATALAAIPAAGAAVKPRRMRRGPGSRTRETIAPMTGIAITQSRALVS